VKNGRYIDYTPDSAVAAGDVVVQGTLVGIAVNDIAAGQLGALCVQGVFDVPKDSSDLSTIGTALYRDADANPVDGTAGTGAFTSTATGNVFAGWSLEAAGPTDGTVRALIVSGFAVSVTTLTALTDVGSISHTEGAILVADGDSYEEVSVTGPLAMSAAGVLSVKTAAVAAAGSDNTDAENITNGFTLVSAANGTKGVKLPTAVAGDMCIVKNNANAILKVYPNTDDKINGGVATTGALSMAAYTDCILVAYDATDWYTIPLLPS